MGGQKFWKGGQKPTFYFLSKNDWKDTIILKKSLKTYSLWPWLARRGKGKKKPMTPSGCLCIRWNTTWNNMTREDGKERKPEDETFDTLRDGIKKW